MWYEQLKKLSINTDGLTFIVYREQKKSRLSDFQAMSLIDLEMSLAVDYYVRVIIWLQD